MTPKIAKTAIAGRKYWSAIDCGCCVGVGVCSASVTPTAVSVYYAQYEQEPVQPRFLKTLN